MARWVGQVGHLARHNETYDMEDPVLHGGLESEDILRDRIGVVEPRDGSALPVVVSVALAESAARNLAGDRPAADLASKHCDCNKVCR